MKKIFAKIYNNVNNPYFEFTKKEVDELVNYLLMMFAGFGIVIWGFTEKIIDLFRGPSITLTPYIIAGIGGFFIIIAFTMITITHNDALKRKIKRYEDEKLKTIH